MVWQWFAAVLPLRPVCLGWSGRCGLRFGGLGNLLVFLEGQVELVEPFRLRAEPMPTMPCKLMLELLHFQGQSLDLVGQQLVHRS